MDRRRPKWVSWIPAVLLSVLILAAVTVAIVATASGVGKPPGAPTEGQVTEKNWSIFTETGLAYIEQTRAVRMDMSGNPVDASEVGLDENGALTIGPQANLDYYLTIYGGPGGARLTVSDMTIHTSDGAVTSVTARVRGASTFRDSLNSLEARAAVFGWDTSNRDILFEQVEQATRDNVPFDFAFGPGTAIGVPVTARVSCEPAGYCVTEYEVAPAVR